MVCLANQIYSQSGWNLQPSGTSRVLQDVQFINSNTGWAVGRLGAILATTNGGTNWIQRTNGTNQDIFKIFFMNANTGWSVCYDCLRRTTDAGVSWTDQAFTYVNANAIYFINSDTGCTAGQYGVITRTSNGGSNWQVVYDGITSDNFVSLYFVNLYTGWAVGTGGLLRKTTNGGSSWFIQNGPSASYHYYSVYFPDPSTGWIVGSVGHIIKTTNGGTNWTTQTTAPYNENLTSVYFSNSLTGWISGFNGRILKTTNGGTNWLPQNSGVVSQLNSVFFSDMNTGWVVGDSGKILKTTDGGGINGIETIGTGIPTQFTLSQNYPNPFNPSSKIKFDIPSGGNKYISSVQLKIYNVLGKEVTTLVNEELKPGSYSVEWNAFGNPSGVYFYKLTAGNFSETKKMVLTK